ncbi:hypothetical protein B0H11DRAFT_2286919 [Mycena galericulata]|nr:hypothetical protein B0H11DRAFT_2286919 [Mycena galericulata]
MEWRRTLRSHFDKVVSVDRFLKDELPKPKSEDSGTISGIVEKCAEKLAVAMDDAKNASVEKAISPSFVEYLNEIASTFPENNKPVFCDTHKADKFEPIVTDDHYTLPDITSTRPGQRVPAKWKWPHAGTVLELKLKVDIFDEHGQIREAELALNALVQLAKSARSLLASSGSCFVFVAAVFGMQARLFRFDHSGFRASEAFNWTENTHIFPTFFWRLYNPEPKVGDRQARILGEDYTISAPTPEEKRQMYNLWTKTPSYTRTPADKRLTFEAATAYSRWVQAALTEDGKNISVLCFTIGPPLFESDGLFSRATRVDRVIIKPDDPNSDIIPTVYALKDAWRQLCRRPEADFYDVIRKHCEKKNIDTDGMPCNHGTIEFSDHTTNSNGKGLLERCRLRTLLTPIGVLLTTFSSSKSLVQALNDAVKQHQIAYEAGVLHRDISEGNILFNETTFEGFLVDFDYAEFTPTGLKNFATWFPERATEEREAKYTDIGKSLKELTGTFPFLAIQILKNKERPAHTAGHDLESVYWLLVWIILRHTHYPGRDSTACHDLFDHKVETAAKLKSTWIDEYTPLSRGHPLYDLIEDLRELVAEQNPSEKKPADSRIRRDRSPQPSDLKPAIPLTHKVVIQSFDGALDLPGWPEDDKAIPFVPPDTTKEPEQAQSRAQGTKDDNLRKDVLKRSVQEEGASNGGGLQTGSGKRKHVETDAEPVGAGSGASSTGSTESRKKRKVKDKMKGKNGTVPLRKPEELAKPVKARGAKKGKTITNVYDVDVVW